MPGPTTRPGTGNADELTRFANGVAAQTGLDPRVIVAWGQLETGGNPIGHNWLNERPGSGGRGFSGVPEGSSPGGFAEFNSTQDAITETAYWINNFSNYAGVKSSGGKPPAQEIAAIAASPWDAGHYGGSGGPNLLREFNSLYPGDAQSPAQTGPTSGVGAPQGVPNPLDTLTKPFKSVEQALTFLTSWRFAEVVGGFALLVVGLVLLGKQFGVNAPTPVPVPV